MCIRLAIVERRTIPIPNGVDVTIEKNIVVVKGNKGELKRDFSLTPVNILRKGGDIVVEIAWPKRREKSILETVCSHIRNMINGVDRGFVYKMKIVFAHFPISVKVSGDWVIIENFCGERSARRAKIVGNTEVSVEGEDVILRGINVEEVGQTAANIEAATRTKKRDPRVFLDGIYLYDKGGG